MTAMKVSIVLAMMLLSTSCAAKSNSAVTPVQKVTQLMQGMLEKAKKEKHEEQVAFASYKQFCDDTTVEKKRAIKETTETLEKLAADIDKHSADIDEATKEIAELDEDTSTWEGDIKAATKVRAIEKSDYEKLHKDYSESIDALERGIAVLKKQAFDRKQKASFAQVSALTNVNLIPADAKRTIDAFLEERVGDEEDLSEAGPPEANAYEFQSQGVVDMLTKLNEKFQEERTSLEKQEKNSKHAYDMLMMDLKTQIGQANKDRTENAEIKAKKLQAKADAEGDVDDSVATKKVDSKYLADLEATCGQKAGDFESRQQLRGEEIAAIEKAIEIISSGDVAGNEKKHSYFMVQEGSALPQLRSNLNTQNQQRVVELLQARAKQLNSRVLATVATKVAGDPFGKVKKMIKDLITRLMEEANEEAEHKGWCDEELGTNAQTRKEKTDTVETLNAEIDQLESSISQLNDDIKDLSKTVVELDAAMMKSTKLRTAEKAKNKETVQDAQAAQTAVAQALTVLKEFYAKAGEATSLVQQQQQEPEPFDEPYKGMQGESGGVVGMLEVIESDFARLESDTKAGEATAQKEYDEFMTDTKVDKAEKATDVEHKNAKLQDQKQLLGSKKGDLDSVQKELDAALEYFDKLKPSCIDSGVSYEDRVARRKEEMASLQDALKILSGDSI